MTKKGPGRVGTAFYEWISLLPPDTIDRMLVIDPGFINCGMATFSKLSNGSWRVTESWKERPFECLDFVRSWLQSATDHHALLIEEFKLYPWQMQQQGFSSMGTPEMIGVLMWLYVQEVGSRTEVDEPAPALCLQGAHWKKPAEVFMKKGGRDFIGPNQHARDAELHGWAMIDRLSRPASRKRANKAAQTRLEEQ